MDLYKDAGVDIAAGNEAASRYKALSQRTKRPEVLGQIGGFASGFALDLTRFPEPVLVSGTDGVGTKLKVAFAADKHDTIGIDCVAMCVNDILTIGAEPLYFLDYLATGKLDVDVAEAVVAGIAAGCEMAGAALVGGETAEMPGMYAGGEYDVAGFAVGVVNRSQMIDGANVRPGDVVLGLASTGPHSNGYSLVRKLVTDAGLQWTDPFPGENETVAETLLRPTRIYVRSILSLLERRLPVHAMAHITGGGLNENIPRVLPGGTAVEIDRNAWPLPNVFQWLLGRSGMAFPEAARVWNMGIGYVLVVPEGEAYAVTTALTELGETVYRIGRVVEGDQVVTFTE
ncbi:phosphoribosylformylglycinamidine cyclo-ligase [Alicyclobacillus dauci]|uniref:Phosphoribosylformylglycinamidine cyclo-ligase n=1 Tax=Alicyclobacillus dauci TaxID=1475485 RepID=A0ABY6Z1E3_9BACL|nr:phosphoribosylformylglycinamidine cyclo-ligase [Alicyclobacillus dauci]WAH36646.1 phosphoribosylformylglycinamidine cyclo-ligase [Alicyclobacillus dauci]